jgi:hypothetical protein
VTKARGPLESKPSGSSSFERSEAEERPSRRHERLRLISGAAGAAFPEEEARLARLVLEGKGAVRRLAEPDVATDERQRLEDGARRGQGGLASLIEHNLPLVVRMTR